MTGPILRFGDFRLDPARRQLWCDDQQRILPPKVFDCIAYLVTHRDRAVGRDELIAAVWGKADVTDNVLDQVMLRARRALGDTGEQRRFIRTMPRFGFGWVAPVEELPEAPAIGMDCDPEPIADAADIDPAPAPRRSFVRSGGARAARRVLLAVIVAGVCALIAIGWLRRPPATAEMPVAALVLPVEVKAEGPFGWARLGIMDLVAERLRLTGRIVLPSDNVVALTREGGPWTRDSAAVAELVRVTGASIVVGGEAELVEGRWRVRLQTLSSADATIAVEAQASDVLEAARLASNSLESALGWAPGIDATLPADSPVALLLRQVDAAQLADQTDVARRLLESIEPAHRDLPEVRFRLASLDFREGRLDVAQAGFESLLGSLPKGDSPLLRARVLNGLANVHMRRDQPALTEALSDQVIDLLADQPPSAELGRALTGRAIARSLQERYDAAMEDFARARVVLESVGDRFGLARVEINVGILDARRYRYAEALPALASAADRLTAYRDFSSELFARVSLARARLELLDARAALAGDERLRELVQIEPSPAMRRYARLTRAMVQYANGRLQASRALLDEVATDATADGDAVLGAIAAALDARAALDAGDAQATIAQARRSLEVPWSSEGPLDYARTWRVLVLAHAQAGQPAQARTALERLRAFAHERSDSGIQVQLTLAEAALADGEDARQGYQRALEQATDRRVPAELLEVAVGYVPWLIARGDVAGASVVAGRTAGWADGSYEAALLQLRFQHAFGSPAGWRGSLDRVREAAGERSVPTELLMAPLPRGTAIPPAK